MPSTVYCFYSLMRNIKLILEYCGTNYHGWQSQAGSGLPTIQGTLEQAIRDVTGESVSLYSSGRTDAGVHALGHVANFFTSSSMPAGAWQYVLNRRLPDDIRVISSEDVPPDFHARRSAHSKVYRYVILNRPHPTAIYRNLAWHVSRPLDIENMRRAAEMLVGRHDFAAFRSSDCGAKSTERTVMGIEIRRRGEFVEIDMEADSFLMHMARNIAGTLAEAGIGRFSPVDVAAILASRDRSKAGKTAPAHGLYLVTVYYP